MGPRPTQKRGGGQALVPLDFELAEKRYHAEAKEFPADRMYERRWALALLAQSHGPAAGEFEQAGQVAEYEQLKGFRPWANRSFLTQPSPPNWA